MIQIFFLSELGFQVFLISSNFIKKVLYEYYFTFQPYTFFSILPLRYLQKYMKKKLKILLNNFTSGQISSHS